VLAHAQRLHVPFGGFPRATMMSRTTYAGGITRISAEARQEPRQQADAAMRAGSIREDVARYNEERATFRPFSRGSGDVPRPPMPSPYRNY
jgi:hypothetical protein